MAERKYYFQERKTGEVTASRLADTMEKGKQSSGKVSCQKPKLCQKQSPELLVTRYKVEEGMGTGTFLQTSKT